MVLVWFGLVFKGRLSSPYKLRSNAFMNRIYFLFFYFFYSSVGFAVYEGKVINTKESSFVGQIIMEDINMSCSAILIRDNLVLTAMHCVHKLMKDQKIHKMGRRVGVGGERREAFRYVFLNGREDDQYLPQKTLKITFRLACDDNDKLLEHTFRVAPRIVFTPYFEYNKHEVKVDFVILQIEDTTKNVPRCYKPEPIELANKLPKELPEESYIIGWGWKSESDTTFDKREGYNIGEIIVNESDPVHLLFSGAHPSCSGDSGGPMFFANDKSKLIGIMSGIEHFNKPNPEAGGICYPLLKEGEKNRVILVPTFERWIDEMKIILPNP
ncbi:hypothetical protein [uncultured Gammaproteobacteria bacterium]|nr:hypothetical protein [uncultured Gammaproteobacteria bacterium]